MKLYLTPYSTFSRRARIALIEKGLQAEEQIVAPNERMGPEYRALNPFGRIPALVDGDVVVYESTAIWTYLEERFPEPPLIPPDPAGRARVAMLVKLCDLEFTPLAIQVQRPKRMQAEATWDRAAMEATRAPIAAHYDFLERELQGREYLAWDRFTLADLAYLPFLHFHALLDVELPPNVDAWWQRLAARDSARRTIPDR